MTKTHEDLQPILTQTFFLSAGETDAEQEMALPLLAAKIIDIATAHANHLGIGNPDMESMHAGWVLSRLSIEMERYPRVNDSYTLSTWIESFNRHFSYRCFRIDDAEGNAMGYARSVWMVMDTQTHQNVGLGHFSMPEEFIFPDRCPIAKQERHRVIVPPAVEPGPTELQATSEPFVHTFKFTDLDAYRHVNTVRYVNLLLNQYSLADFDAMRVKRLELSFMHEAHYGRPVCVLRHDNAASGGAAESAFLLIDKEGGTPILYGRIFRTPR